MLAPVGREVMLEVTEDAVEVEEGVAVLEVTVSSATTHAAIVGAQSKIDDAVAKQACWTERHSPVGSRQPKYWAAQKAWLASGATSQASC